MRVLHQHVTERVAVYHADCVDVLRGLPDNSIHFGIWSPPFSSLFVYSNSERDMGNSRGDEEFFAHHAYLVKEVKRVMMPGRLVAMHCWLMPSSKEKDGYIGLRDFRGDLIRAFQAEGFIFHSEIAIQKDPVVQMQRTKALGLLHKQLKKDSAMSRQGLADYLVVMRKPGVNPEPIAHTNDSFPVSLWQEYARPCWTDIDQSDTLQRESARENEDERHISPLQLGLIGKAIHLWTNPDDIVLSTFVGIGSELYMALKAGRRGVGAELKHSYYKQAVANLHELEFAPKQLSFL